MGDFIRQVKESLQQPLPGIEAHKLVASYRREPAQVMRQKNPPPRESAVLMLMYPKEMEWYTVVIRRPDYDGVHSGQISFPGGKAEPGDADLSFTALRECSEEIGTVTGHIEIAGQLSEIYIPPSNFIVTPFVGIAKQQPIFIPDPKEVDRIIEFPVSRIMDADVIKSKEIYIGVLNRSVDAVFFDLAGETVWGATAMILMEFREILKRMPAFPGTKA